MFEKVTEFELAIAKFYGAPYAIATDCCTHAIELCLRLIKPACVACPTHTYLSIPMTFEKLGLAWEFVDHKWQDFYNIINTNIIDAAVYWKAGGYQPGSLMCLSFQFKKHLNLGRGGMILTDNQNHAHALKRMSYDGRRFDMPWTEQDIDTIGYHYYMTPETAQLGLKKLEHVKDQPAKVWSYQDYPDLSTMKVFKK